jgi:hypothetical protein
MTNLTPEQPEDDSPMYPDMPEMSADEEEFLEDYDDSMWSTGDSDDYY